MTKIDAAMLQDFISDQINDKSITVQVLQRTELATSYCVQISTANTDYEIHSKSEWQVRKSSILGSLYE